MKLYKLTFFPLFSTDFKDASLGIWTHLKELIEGNSSCGLVEWNGGSRNATCLVASGLTQKELSNLVIGFISETDEKNQFGITVKAETLSKDEIEKLKSENERYANDERIASCLEGADVNSIEKLDNAEALAPFNDSEKEDKKNTEEAIDNAYNSPVETSKAADSNEPVANFSMGDKTSLKKSEDKTPEQNPPKPETLSELIKMIADLKNYLLANVKGQRHAIDVFTQGIFETEAFTSHNDKRKGVEALFLFAGPSGVGKTYLAELSKDVLSRPFLRVDMSEFSDNLANMNFNGEHGSKNMVTGFVNKNPKSIILFDEIEKAHINTIYLFLQLLDAGRLFDYKLNKEISFKDVIVIITTNVGKSLYEDPTRFDLSTIPSSTVLDALSKEVNPQNNSEAFPKCIVTRMANGNVILFNHLEPYALRSIIEREIATQFEIFEKAYGVTIEYNPEHLSALVLYKGGGFSDARTLRGMARGMVSKELHDVINQVFVKKGNIADIKKIKFTVEPMKFDDEIKSLFSVTKKLRVLVFAATEDEAIIREGAPDNIELIFAQDLNDLKKKIRGVSDYVLLDVCRGYVKGARIPSDIEDLETEGTEAFHYIQEFYPEIPIELLNTRNGSEDTFATLLGKGARGVIKLRRGRAFRKDLEELTFAALVNNGTFELARAGKVLSYNCAQYVSKNAVTISFNRLKLIPAPSAEDSQHIRKSGQDITFKDVSGCGEAKKTLMEFAGYLDNPREMAMKGKRMPKGVLLYGPPGTGKTLLAKAMANECKATFIPTTATAFFNPYVGVSEQNVRDVFQRARRYAPSIIFIDEVDAIGRNRTGASNSSHVESVLNAFIAEMDGFIVDEKRPVFILAATNYEISGPGERVLDKAFVRRFDRAIFVDLPNEEERAELLSKKLAKHGIVGFDNAVKSLAERAGGMSCAELEMMIEFALRMAGDNELTEQMLIESLDAYRYGEEKEFEPDNIRQTACHEAGHALLNWLSGDVPTYLTIVSRGNFGGYMQRAEDKRGTLSRKDILSRLRCSLAGRGAECVVYGDSGINTGASSDLEHARFYIDLYFRDFAMGDKLYAKTEDADLEKAIKAEYDNTLRLIKANIDVLNELTDCLVAEKCMDEKRLSEFFGAKTPIIPELIDIQTIE